MESRMDHEHGNRLMVIKQDRMEINVWSRKTRWAEQDKKQKPYNRMISYYAGKQKYA